MQDIAGIDVGWRIRQHLKSAGKTRAEGPQSAVPDRLYEMGRYGQKTGAGWYRYESRQSNAHSRSARRGHCGGRSGKRGVTRRAVADEEIIARIMTALANEGARVLEEGYATRASDIDVVYVHGFGFPRHRGGPMFYADTVGLADRSGTSQVNTAGSSAITGSRRPCSRDWRSRAAASTATRHDRRRSGGPWRAGRSRGRHQRLARGHTGPHRRICGCDGRPSMDTCRCRARPRRDAVRRDHRARIPDAVAAQRVDARRRDGRRPAHDPQLRAQPRAFRVAGAVRLASPRANRARQH